MSATETVTRTEYFDVDVFDHEEAVADTGAALREGRDIQTIDEVDVSRTETNQWVVSVSATLAMGRDAR